LPWTTIKTQLSLSRKIMALGKFLEHLRAAAEHFARASKHEGKTVQFLQAVRQLGYTGLIVCDNIYVVHTMEVRKVANVKKIQRLGNLFWLMSLAASVLSGLHIRLHLGPVQEKDTLAEMKRDQIIRYANPLFLGLACPFG
jgi:peroxin-11B